VHKTIGIMWDLFNSWSENFDGWMRKLGIVLSKMNQCGLMTSPVSTGQKQSELSAN
jgi:hypothetical protein